MLHKIPGHSYLSFVGAKRAPEVAAAATRQADPKRLKTEAHSSPPQQPSSSSPPLTHAPPPTTTQPPTQSPTQPPTQPPSQPARVVSTMPPPGREQAHLQALIIKRKHEVQEHRQMGRMKEAEAGQKELSQLWALFQRLAKQQPRIVSASQSQPELVGLNNASGARPVSGSGLDGGSSGQNTMQASTSMPMASGSAASNNITAQAEAQPNRPVQPAQPPHPENTPIVPSAPHNPPGQGSANVLTTNVPPPELPQTSPAMSTPQALRAPGQPQSGFTRVWEGGITWVDPSSRRQLHANVALNGPEMMYVSESLPPPEKLNGVLGPQASITMAEDLDVGNVFRLQSQYVGIARVAERSDGKLSSRPCPVA